ncbi:MULTISPECIES: CRISPR-associated protein (Cas_Cmr3) [Nostocales]|uniref:CRISPR-associated protein n=3 Tax=Nostocales TaxID=1161 RepID=A0A0C1NEV8_9CYAN|nr:CRISPR-associated protein (Cas_Cmr3) [Tolypothrix bouteillei]KAF3887640.1 CRISPR-associated protein [Tolypothrix bouteillei VB521301]
MFKYLIIIKPLGFLYGSAGAFLSPENLVGHSGEKFPPSAAALSGLFFSAKLTGKNLTEREKNQIHKELSEHLHTAGAFWAKSKYEQDFYVPIPWHRIIGGEKEKYTDEWVLDRNENWQRKRQYQDCEDKLEVAFTWQTITSWGKKKLECATHPWDYVSFLHPHMKDSERHSKSQDGLFLERAVQMPENTCLVYLSSHELDSGWYRFGGENHIVEIECQEIKKKEVCELFKQPIKQAFALITPAIWGSTRFSFRFPQHSDLSSYFPEAKTKLLTDKAIPYRYSTAGRLGRGRYAVPAGSVYVLPKPLNLSWSQFKDDWFPNEGYSLKKIGCGLCLPVEITGLPKYQEA